MGFLQFSGRRQKSGQYCKDTGIGNKVHTLPLRTYVPSEGLETHKHISPNTLTELGTTLEPDRGHTRVLAQDDLRVGAVRVIHTLNTLPPETIDGLIYRKHTLDGVGRKVLESKGLRLTSDLSRYRGTSPTDRHQRIRPRRRSHDCCLFL